MKSKLFLIVVLLAFMSLFATGQTFEIQSTSAIGVSEDNKATVEAFTNHGKFSYHIDNTGDLEVSAALQLIFDELASLENVSATVSFLPGVYYLDAPISIHIASIKLVGHGHGGIDIHGANMESGTILRLGKNCGPNCLTFDYSGRSKAFPSGESPWHNQNLKVELENLSFVDYNNNGRLRCELYQQELVWSADIWNPATWQWPGDDG